MEQQDIAQLLDTSYSNFINFVEQTTDDFWLYAPANKWTTGQHSLHLIQSTDPLNLALSLPGFILRWKYGQANRAVRPYDQVVQRYKDRLSESTGKVFKGSKNMGIPKIEDKAALLQRLHKAQKKLQAKTVALSDKALDNNIVPHPLMGKMPLREIIMWSAYHVDHHLLILQNYLKQYQPNT